MKRLNIKHILASIIMTAAISTACQDENTTHMGSGCIDGITFYAHSGEVDMTKTSRQEDGTIWWTPGDEIKVFCGSTSGKFTSQNTENAATATFTGEFGGLVSSEYLANNGVAAFYPYSEDVEFDGDAITFTLPSSQTGVAGTFNDDLFPAIAKSNSTNLSFYNICGGAKFSVTRNDIKSVTLKGNNNELLAGKAKVTFDKNGIPTINIIEGIGEVVVTAPDNGTFEAGKSYYIVTFPQSLGNGFELIYNNGEMANNSFKKSEKVTIKRSKFGLLSNLDEGLGMADLSAPIEFADALMKELCVNAFDTNGDGELSYTEAAAVTDLSQMTLTKKTFESFDEFQYFTSVKAIPNSYFKGSSIKAITLPRSITLIGNEAFVGCANLTSVGIPENVTSLGDYAFYGCANLASITIPENVTSIGDYVFYGCANLASITIPENVTSIGDYAFYDCKNLRAMTIPGAVTTIGNNAFMRCINLQSVTMQEGIASIGSDAFNQCTKLWSITIPESLQSIGSNVFYACYNLTSITIPGNITSIGEDIFYDCKNLESVVIQEGITSIGKGMFLRCSSILTLTLPESITSIEDNAFDSCKSLTSITIPESVTSIGNSAFEDCANLAFIMLPESITAIGNDTFGGCSNLASIIIPESVVSIGERSFTGCSQLSTITLPNKVTSIGSQAFSYCSNLTSITIPNSVTYIGDMVFSHCTNLSSIVLPQSITSIEDQAFSNCSNLTSITIPESITTIGIWAFDGCTKLSTITIPQNVTLVDTFAFEGCANLISVYLKPLIPPAIPTTECFANNASDRKFYVPSESVEAYKTADIWSSFADYIVGYDFENNIVVD